MTEQTEAAEVNLGEVITRAYHDHGGLARFEDWLAAREAAAEARGAQAVLAAVEAVPFVQTETYRQGWRDCAARAARRCCWWGCVMEHGAEKDALRSALEVILARVRCEVIHHQTNNGRCVSCISWAKRIGVPRHLSRLEQALNTRVTPPAVTEADS